MSKKIEITGNENDFSENLKKSLGEMLILFLLKQRPMYTYELAQEMEHVSAGTFTYHSLYNFIYRLKSAECIEEERRQISQNRTRIYFHVTEKGKTHLIKIRRIYRELTMAADLILDLDGVLYENKEDTP